MFTGEPEARTGDEWLRAFTNPSIRCVPTIGDGECAFVSDLELRRLPSANDGMPDTGNKPPESRLERVA